MAKLCCVVFVLVLLCFVCSGFLRDHTIRRSKLVSLYPPSGTWQPNCSFVGTVNLGDLCHCLGNVANCSGVGMRIIPDFDREITMLFFSFNSLILRDYGASFRHLPNITHLDLSDNGILEFPQSPFRYLKRLKVLDFSMNLKNYGEQMSLLSDAVVRNIEELDATLVYPRELFPVKLPSLPNLRILIMDSGYTTIDLESFQDMSNLTELSMVGIKSATVQFIPDNMSRLEKLNLSYNNLLSFIPTCYDLNGMSTEPLPVILYAFFPRLKSLDLSRNLIGGGFPYTQPFTNVRCLPELRNLSLDYNILRSIRTGEFSTPPSYRHCDKADNTKINVTSTVLHKYPNLQHLSLKDAGSNLAIEPFAFNNSVLLTLDLSLNGIQFASDDISPEAFAGCTSLLKLNLEGNIFIKLPEEKFHSLFAPLKSLQHLDIGNTKLDRIGKGLFSCLKNVTTLLLHDNLISTIPDGTFDDLEYLTVLKLDNNQIVSVRESTFTDDTFRRLTSFSISNNPFECTCSLLWFRDRVIANPKLFKYEVHSEYECKNLAGTDLSSFMQNKQPCILGHDAYVFTMFCLVALISTLILASQLYRYRWHIRLVLYELFRGKSSARWQQRRPEEFLYDLFVSYDSEDESWVTQHLMPALEDGWGLRLCVHQRDFIPGKNIVDNIVDSLEVSRRVLAVFSPRFAESHWCHFELEMCLGRVIDRNDVMIVVMLQHVPSRDMSGAMLALINTTTYIKWVDDPDVRDWFWRKMTLALRNVLPGLGQ